MKKKSKEYEDWFKACDFIKKEMQFYSVKDFWGKKDDICYYFKEGNSYIRQLYMWYFFSNPNLSDKQKELYWDVVTGGFGLENDENML